MASSNFPVAVIGIGVRLPGAENCQEFWELMMNGEDTVGEFPPERAADVDHVVSSFRGQLVNEDKPFFTGSFFKSVDKFDPDVFQINPREAHFIEPEQRFFLEVVWELLEDAGYASKIRGSNTGVYVGNTVNKYKYILNENHPSISHGNHSPFISSRVSYTHDLHGPAMMVATGCSSSLLAVHLACQGLLSGDCQMAIAGGITLDLLPISAKTDIWNQLGITGPHVKCRAFDAAAKGIAKGEGCGVVLLKPLHKAIEDGDNIYGILEATTANQDGHSNGITAPHPVAQANMLTQAWKLAEIKPDVLGFFEAHGTGTELGDPIEISGITNAFKMSGVKGPFEENTKIPIGSVKANIGHLADGAAGIVGLIKALLCIHKNKIPGAINFNTPNPHINWKKSPVYVNTSPLDWSAKKDAPRFASVSAFGLLGTNIHAVVKEYEETGQKIVSANGSKSEILCLAAQKSTSLATLAGKLCQYFKNCEDRSLKNLQNVCYTINTGREQKRFPFRVTILAESWEDMEKLLHQVHQAMLNKSFESKCLQNHNLAVSFNGVDQFNNLGLSKTNSTAVCLAVKTFLKGNKVSWIDFYQDFKTLQIVPQLPTYPFDHIRLWPTIETPINRELLQLEHKTIGRSDYHGFLLENTKDTQSTMQAPTNSIAKHKTKSGGQISKYSDTDLNGFLKSSLNSALNTQHDWEDLKDENLFVLGMDSLILSQVSMTLQDKTGTNISMTEFRRNPSFSGLLNILETVSKGGPQTPPAVVTDPCKNIDVEVALKQALDEALGITIDWTTNIHENLFTLGVDSLIYTHVNMSLKEATGLDAPITMAELHDNPTFDRLCLVLNYKMEDNQERTNTSLLEQPNREDNNTDDIYPISFAQRRLWVMQQLITNPCAYNATNCLKFTGDFHPVAFTTSVNHTLSKNAAFYTIIEDSSTGPVQKHDWHLKIDIQEEDLAHMGDDAEATVTRLYEEDYKTPFVLSQGPLVRCKLYHLPNNIFYYTMVIHHIIFDGWSHFVFYNELWTAYNDIIQGKAIKSSLKKTFYTEIAQKEQQLALSAESRLYKDIEYWMKKLSGTLPFTTFPGDRKRPPVFTYNGGRITRFIKHELLQKLGRISQNQHTMFMTLLSSVYSLLKRYTGESDFIIGTPIAGRYDLKSSNVIGCFINTLALRVQLTDNLSFEEVLEEVSEVCLEAYDHQQAAFDNLVSHLNLPRDTSITPVFSINVCYHNTEMKGEHVNPPEELTVERKLLHNDTSKWDMQFDFLHEPEGMRFTLEYYTDVFSEEYASCIVDNFLALLNSIANDPSTPLEKITITNTPGIAEYMQASIMKGENTDLGDNTLPELLMDSIAQTVSSYVTDESNSVTYSELLSNIFTLSSFLRGTCNLHKGDRVGLLMDNSTKTLEAVVTSLMSQLVYVPLDVNSPKSRLEHICSEAKLKAIMFNNQYIAMANHLQWVCPSVKTILCLDADVFSDIKEAEESPLMNTELWDCVASQAVDKIEGGGWMSSYTGEHMSEQEMNEYSHNVYSKLKPFLKPSKSVLEIGCASGLTTQIIKPRVRSYVATDLSQQMVSNIQKIYVDDNSFSAVCAPADQVGEKCKDRKFDIIIINSVIHCFPGYNYLRKVLRDCEHMLSVDGIIFLGDLMDLDLRDKLVASMKSFKASHPEHRVKTDWTNELFIPKRFLDNFCSTSQILMSTKHSRKIYSIRNELTEFRFDSILSRSVIKKTEKLQQCQTFALEDIKQIALTNADQLRECVKDISMQDEAYILYTSGTTGTPKGVVISHEALLNYTVWASNTYRFTTKTTTTFFAPMTFDFTVTSIFPPLLKGSNIKIYKNFQDSYQKIADSTDLTIGKFSPMQLDMMLSSTNKQLSIKTYILGGEELTSTLLAKLKENQGNDYFKVWNEYGPTEATVGCVVKCFNANELPLAKNALVTIGHPIDNVTIAVVKNNQLMPVGAKGYLAIGGKCLCSNFVGEGETQKAKELQSFRNGLWGSPVDRMLLTEDLVEVLPRSKEMAYFGRRNDETTKVNGIRVDITEVESAIEKIYFVKSAWVCSFDFEGHTFLGAVVEMRKLTKTNADWKQAIVEEVKQSLPLRAIPKVFVEVLKPPTNQNGKKDLKYLKTQFTLEMQSSSQSNATEIDDHSSNSQILGKLQKIWHSILPINYLPRPNQNFFFDLSGDSLQAIHLVRKMRDEGFKVTVTDIFQNPTIEKLMRNLTMLDEQTVTAEEENIPFRPTPIVEDFVLQEKLFPDYFALSALLDFHQKVDSNMLRAALRSVMQKHGSLRSKLYKENGNVWQMVVALKEDQPNIIEVEFESKEIHLSDEKEFKETCEKMDRSHSLEDATLVGGAIFNIKYPDGKKKCYCLLVVHHAALDIVSWQQILEDLAAAFRSLSKDPIKEPELKPCQLTFRSYCNAVHAESSGIFVPEVSYWSDVEQQSLKAGILVEKNVQSKFKTAKWYSKSMEASVLRATSTGMGCSDEQVLLTAFGRSMSILHGKDKTTLCMESHGRQLQIDSSDTVGWCTSMFPFILNTPLKDDMFAQVKKVGEDVDAIPNHGLGFGLLKSAGKISMAHPKVTFIFQGSLDASSKETLDGGTYNFDHIPWIEIMLNELRQGRFHRHLDEVLEFDLEFIAWIHSGELKFGCLFDEETVSQATVEEIVKHAEINLNILAKRVGTKPTNINITIIPGFTVTPDFGTIIVDSLKQFNINMQSMSIESPEVFVQSLFKEPTSNTDLTVVIPRLRSEQEALEFQEIWSEFEHQRKNKVAVLDVHGLPKSHKLEISGNQAPVSKSCVHSCHYDENSDTEYNMPLSKDGYIHLGLDVARVIKAFQQKTPYKVVAVDGDYTLWNGECAQGQVTLNQGNIALQKYLVNLKRCGVLLVLLSKNEHQDVKEVFQKCPKHMVLTENDFVSIKANWDSKYQNITYLAKHLNLGLDAFVFIDDNVLECEEMLRNCPEVLTLLYPGESTMVEPFIESLWMLDTITTSKESATRTEMYRHEMTRQEEISKVKDKSFSNNKVGLMRALRDWNMEINIIKTTIKEIKNHPNICKRVVELLHRTNQFKLNTVHTDMTRMPEEHHAWIILLSDSRGSYGIVSILIMDVEKDTGVVQWVVSCRALNRYVENRILYELQSSHVGDRRKLYFDIQKTKRNTPMLNFIKEKSKNFGPSTEIKKYEIQNGQDIDLSLHKIVSGGLVDVDTETPKEEHYDETLDMGNCDVNDIPTKHFSEFINEHWTPILHDQASKHMMFPLIPQPDYFQSPTIFKTGELEDTLVQTWMDVLGSSTTPGDTSNFLREGGTSFSAVFLVSKIRQMHNINLSIVDLLRNPTFAAFKKIVFNSQKMVKTENVLQEGKDADNRISAAQQRMLLMQESARESTANVETIAVSSDHPLNATQLVQKLQTVHPILTSRITTSTNQQDYLLTDGHDINSNIILEEIDCEDIAEFVSDTIPVINVLSSPLAVFRYIQTQQRHYFILHIHHIICDDVTLSSMRQTIKMIIDQEEFKTEKPYNYSNYVKSEKSYRRSPKFHDDQAFWEKSYSTVPNESTLSDLPDGQNASSDSKIYHAKHKVVEIPNGGLGKILDLATTEFQVYIACSAIIVQEYLGTPDVTLAVPVTTRSSMFEETDGLFVNTVIPKLTIDAKLTLAENIKSISATWLQGLNHSQYPLDELSRFLWTRHNQSFGSLCYVMVNFLTSHNIYLKIPSKHAKMPLSIDFLEDATNGKLVIWVEWAAEIISDDKVARITDSLVQLLTYGVQILTTPLRLFSCLTKSELALIKSFNESPITTDVDLSLCNDSFENHVRTHGDKTAVLCEGRISTYTEIDQNAKHIASGILSLVNQKELKSKPVVLLMNKSEEAIMAILGVWKAGGHFLPVSLSNKSTLKDICNQANPALVLTYLSISDLEEEFGKQDYRVYNIGDLWELPCNDFTVEQSIDDLAYTIRTSGSTGIPKQCKISHRSLQTMAAAWKTVYNMTSYNVNLLQWAPLSFDVFVGDIARALVAVPGTLVMCPDERRLDLSYILKLIKEQQVSLMEVTPQFGQQLVENANAGELDSLKILILGSDVVKNQLFSNIKSQLKSHQRLINSYGMTEATIDSAFFEGEPPITRSGTVPIGKPYPGVQLHILQPHSTNPCAVGTVGELYIRGDTLASGDVETIHLYGEKMLKTGDSACWLPNGDIELLGRLDNMMKLRGFRISTTEIENKILARNNIIRSVCVLPVTNENDVEFLCAFVVLSEDDVGSVTKTSVGQLLKGDLPYYMIPDVVHIIDELPLTANGKVNTKSLSNLKGLFPSINNEQSLKQDSSSTVVALTKLFAESMSFPNMDCVNTEQTFMEQGGHSLILLRFYSSIKQQTDYNISIADIFSYPSISSLASHVEEQDAPVTADVQDETKMDCERVDIAITGVGMRLPGDISSMAELWKVLTNGEDLIKDFPSNRKDDVLKCMDATKADTLSQYNTFKASFLDNIDQFDHQFFKIAPGEAKYMSPEQRLFLQVATEALSEGRNITNIRGSKVGVFVGNSEIGYSELDQPDEAISISGLMPGMIATRVAYQFDLKGPTMMVDTACSSSLMALKLASESILKGECDGALVGGVNLVLYPARTGVFGEMGILSPDFHCRAFDKDATGTAVGEGVMCIYLEPLQIAQQNGKPIYGIVKGVASNSVGHGNGITAPSASSQKHVIESALHLTNLKPSDISFIETHGTGTKLGDRIELSALSSVFTKTTGVNNLPIGAVKSVFGHLDSAAGMIGLLKVLASMTFQRLPPTAHFKHPHPELEDSTLCVPIETKSIPVNTSKPFAAGISSFGLTGTNCHAIITQCRMEEQTGEYKGLSPLLLVGKDFKQIQNQISRYVTFIEECVVKSEVSNINALCITVARRIQDMDQAKLGHTGIRIVLQLRTSSQALKVLRLIRTLTDKNDVHKLAAVRNDITTSSSQRCLDGAVDLFISHGTINIEELFKGVNVSKISTPGVYVDIFSPTRHWMDASSSTKMEQVGLMEILEKKLNDTRELVRSLPLAATRELRELEGRFCVALIIKLLLNTKVDKYLEHSSEVSLKAVFKETGMMAKYDKLFYVMIREMYDNHVVKPTGQDKTIHCLDTFKFDCAHILDADPNAIASYAMDKYPAWSDCFRFPLYCSQYLTKVLWGNMSPLSVIYPQGDLNYMYQFNRLGDLIGDVYYNMYMQLIGAYAKQLSSRGRKVRILEVGAGMGHVTRQLIPKLKDVPNIEYWFTDLGKAFVENAKTLFSDYLHMMKFSTFDITKSAPKQGLLGSYDIVISYNVIHTTESVLDSVTNLKSCLGDDGTLFVIESAKNETWATLAWGILDGWWYFKDYDMRPDEPMMEPEKWERVLKDSGFGSVHSCPVDEFERDQVEKFLFVCSARPLTGTLKQLPGWWETIDLKTRRHQDLEDEICSSNDTGVEDSPIERNAISEELKQIWCELFGISDIKPEDEFNALGGESLMAIQMMTMVRKRIGYQLEIADTFGYPSLGGLADFIADNFEDTDEHSNSVQTEQWSNISTPNSLSDIDETECVNTLLMFPGQGSQKPGMCVSMKDSPEARRVFQSAKKIFGYNILDLFLEGGAMVDEKLKSTEFVQVALLVGCLAKIEQIKAENPEKLANITHVSGLSVGEFAALVHTSVISFEDALKIVQVRGRAMENEVKRSSTGMVSVFGPDTVTLQQFLDSRFPGVKISTYLADNQHTLAGTDAEVEELVRVLSGDIKEEMNIIDVRKLRVAGAFHSTYMRQASKVVDPIIHATTFHKPSLPLIMNVTGEIVDDPVQIKTLVCEQLVAPVMWKQTVMTAYNAGVNNFLEVAPARVLSSIVKNRISCVKDCSVDLIVT